MKYAISKSVNRMLWQTGILFCMMISMVQAQTLIVQDDHYGIPFGRPLQVEASGVLDNDTFDGEPAGENGATAELVSGPGHGVLQCPSDIELALCPDGSFDYTPGDGFPGSDSFEYLAVTDNTSSSATVTLTACTGGPDLFACWHESAYLELLTDFGYASFWESFEGDVWDIARSPYAAASVTSQGIVWTTNHPVTNNITTGTGPARTGLYGVFDPEHGFATGSPGICDVDVPPEHCLFHDGFSGSLLPSEDELHGVGGFITGTWGQKTSIFLNGATEIPFGNLPGYRDQFIGVVDASTAGFRSYEFRELDGTIGQAEYIWGDDFTFAINPPVANTAPVADAGLPQTVMINDVVMLDGSGSSDLDDDTLTHRWSFESLPVDSYPELDTTNPVYPEFTADELGTYLIRLIVNDGTVDSIPDTVEITAGCSGDVVSVSNTTVPFGLTECIASTSVTIGPNVLVVPGAILMLYAPDVGIGNGVTVELGATFGAGSVP